MRSIFLLLILALPLKAQDLTVPCEAPAKTLRLLEDFPPLRDVTIPYESRIGALRALAMQYPEDFFIQRAVTKIHSGTNLIWLANSIKH